MQVRLLGPVDVLVDGQPREVRGLRRSAALATLALHAGQVVSTSLLSDAVWDGIAPAKAIRTLHSHVAHLRGLLGSKEAIVARPPGYQLDLPGDGTDARAAERLFHQGAKATEPGQAVAHLRAALALWRGRPLANVAALSWLGDQASLLDTLHEQVKRALCEARLNAGEHAGVLPGLEEMMAEHPLDEQVCALLMLALYRCGRQAEALSVFQRLRHGLAGQMGLDPGRALRELEIAVLRQSPALRAPAPPAARLGAALPAPVPAPAWAAATEPPPPPPAVPGPAGPRPARSEPELPGPELPGPDLPGPELPTPWWPGPAAAPLAARPGAALPTPVPAPAWATATEPPTPPPAPSPAAPGPARPGQELPAPWWAGPAAPGLVADAATADARLAYGPLADVAAARGPAAEAAGAEAAKATLPESSQQAAPAPSPAQTVPAQTVPAQTVPAQAVPAQAVPAQTVPAQTVPAQTVPAQAVPAQTVPAQTVPTAQATEPAAPVAPVPLSPAPARVLPVPATPALAAPAPAVSGLASPAPAVSGSAVSGRAVSVPAVSVSAAPALPIPVPAAQSVLATQIAPAAQVVLAAQIAAAARIAAVPVPAQLPPAAPVFAGRIAELDSLDLLAGTARNGSREATAAVTVTVAGTAGAGKTELAVQWAHRTAGEFPDGQLYVNLRGFDPRHAPVDPGEAAEGFLAALGVPPSEIPVGTPARAGLYRSLLAGRRVLVVLDNARDADQVRPLLPAAPGCLAIVTSRSNLASLVAVEGARPLALGLLADAGAHELLARRLGRERVASEPRAVARIIKRCCGLPLALAAFAARAATSPRFPLAVFAAELHDPGNVLDAIGSDDPAADVRTALSCSYRALSAEAASVFRSLGTHPSPVISQAAVPATALPPGREYAVMAELTSMHLLSEDAPGSFSCHGLLRAYARELSGSEGSPWPVPATSAADRAASGVPAGPPGGPAHSLGAVQAGRSGELAASMGSTWAAGQAASLVPGLNSGQAGKLTEPVG